MKIRSEMDNPASMYVISDISSVVNVEAIGASDAIVSVVAGTSQSSYVTLLQVAGHAFVSP